MITKDRAAQLAEMAARMRAVAAADAEIERIAPQFTTGKALRRARERLIVRLLDRTPCACGAEATICFVGPPVRWYCPTCDLAAFEEVRAAYRPRT